MAKVTILGVDAFEGEYTIDFGERPITGRDAHIIKEVSGVRAGELEEAGQRGDADLIIAFALIALLRHGKITYAQFPQATEVLLDAELGKIRYEETEADAGPPAQKASEPASEPAENSKSSSPSSNGTSDDHPETIPTPTGIPGWGV